MKVLKAIQVVPAVVFSTVVVTWFAAALPAAGQLVLFYGGLILLSALCFGVGERWGVAAFLGGRRMTAVESVGLAPVVAELCQLELGPPISYLFVARSSTAAPATARGRRAVLLSPELVHASLTGRLPQREVTAVVAHAVVVGRSGLARQDVAIAFWTMPWRILARFGRRWSKVLLVTRLCGTVMGVVVFYQTVSVSHDPNSPVSQYVPVVGVAVLLVLAYAVPWASTRWTRRMLAVGDDGLVARGLGPAMAAFVRRDVQTLANIGRVQVLDPPAAPKPQLRLVVSQ